MADNVLLFPTPDPDPNHVDLDAIRHRVVANTYRTDRAAEGLPDLVDVGAMREDLLALLRYCDQELVVRDESDMPKVDGSLPDARVPQIVLARLVSANLAAIEHLHASAAYYGAVVTLSPNSPTVRERADAMFEKMNLSRVAHGLPSLPRR